MKYYFSKKKECYIVYRWEKPDGKSTLCTIPFIENPRKCKLICSGRKQGRGRR